MNHTNHLWMCSCLLLFFCLSFCSVPAAFSQEATEDLPITASISNFEAVTPALWRGGEPDERGLQDLAHKGVNTVIDLRMWNSAAEKESRSANKLGLKYVRIPMTYWGPSKESVRQFFATVAANKDGITYVHCHQGADRTGTLVALYRVLVQKWEFPRVYKEMRAHHFKPWLFALKEKIETTASSKYVPEKDLVQLLATCGGILEKIKSDEPTESAPQPHS